MKKADQRIKSTQMKLSESIDKLEKQIPSFSKDKIDILNMTSERIIQLETEEQGLFDGKPVGINAAIDTLGQIVRTLEMFKADYGRHKVIVTPTEIQIIAVETETDEQFKERWELIRKFNRVRTALKDFNALVEDGKDQEAINVANAFWILGNLDIKLEDVA